MHRSTCRTSHKAGTLRASNMHFLLLCFLVIMLPGCAQERSSLALSPDAFARKWIEAWNSHDVNRILTYYTDDAFYEDVPSVENGLDVPLRGQQMIRASLVKTFEEMPDLSLAVVSASDAGDRLVVEWNMTGSHYRDFTGRFSVRAVSVIELKEERIAWERDYYDIYLPLSRLGLVPALDAEQPKADRDSATQ